MAAFEDKRVIRKVTLLKQWISLKLNDCSSMQEYVTKCLSLRSKVKAAGFNIDEEIAGSILLCGLPDEFKPMIMSVETNGKNISVDFVKHILLQEVDFEKSSTEKVLTVSTKKRNTESYRKYKNKEKRSVKC